MFSQQGYRIPPQSNGAPIALQFLGSGSAGGKVAGADYAHNTVTVGTMDKWILGATITISVNNSTVSRISNYAFISGGGANVYNFPLVNEQVIASPTLGNAACIQHWGIRVNDGLNFGNFVRTVDPGGADAQWHYYSRLRVIGSALNLSFFDEGGGLVDTDTNINSGSFNNNGTTEQTFFNFYRNNAIGGVGWIGEDIQHYKTTLGAVSYIGEARVGSAQTAHTIGATWAAARSAIALTTRIKSV